MTSDGLQSPDGGDPLVVDRYGETMVVNVTAGMSPQELGFCVSHHRTGTRRVRP
ncbi:MAG: hypothetical protein AB7G47_22795 [Mycolicibacterium sp.]|uniref:hypothetical protein n=1 Tax=Mycolicibacterium sp. TaxID=2320850 RepID=UPI003D0CD93B